MANTIYLTTHDGLTSLVSARAASQVLDKALKKRGQTPETVGPEEMSTVLLGPVLEEFTGILPRDGLERSLKGLVRSLRKLPQNLVEAQDDLKQVERLEVEEVTEEIEFTSAVDDTVEETETPLPTSPQLEVDGQNLAAGVEGAQRVEVTAASPTVQSREQIAAEIRPQVHINVTETPWEGASAAVETPQNVTTREPEDSAAPPKLISEEQLEDAVLRFAQLDNVKIVAAFTNVGKVVQARGGGYDLETLSRVGMAGLALLGRSGRLRSYYLAHSLGQLFLFPLGSFTLILIGNADLNLGQTFATLQKLEEEV